MLACLFGSESIISPISANTLASIDLPEEVLRAEIITEARSPIDGKPLSAIEFAELIIEVNQRAEQSDGILAAKDPKIKNLVFLLRLRSFLRSAGIPIK